MTHDWPAYFEKTRNRPPSPLLKRALPFVQKKQNALDLGAGALADTKFLLSEGFSVTAVDNAPAFLEECEKITASNFQPILSSFDEFTAPPESFDLVTAMFALPFCLPEKFSLVIDTILSILVHGGIFSGNFFGQRDGFRSTKNDMTFHTREEIEKMFHGHVILWFDEREYNSPTAAGQQKHWHVFNVIIRKK